MKIWHNDIDEPQSNEHMSFVGGIPHLPRGHGVPRSEVTRRPMTFFFQLLMPSRHSWAGKIVSTFCDTDYADDNELIPKLPRPLEGAHLPADFFVGYDRWFKVLALDPAHVVPVQGYRPIIRHNRLRLGEPEVGGRIFGEMTSSPRWELGDESPASFAGSSDGIEFLFQSALDYEFAVVAGAPRQKQPDYRAVPGSCADRLVPEYRLFVSNAIYYFGIKRSQAAHVYLVPQS